MLRVAVARSVLRLRPSNVMCFCSVPSEAGKEPPKEKPKFNYKTLDQYKSEGGHSSMRDSHGIGFSSTKPTPGQRKLLVLLRMYKSDAEIPESVSMQTLTHMRDRLRVVIAVSATVLFFFFFVMVHDHFQSHPTPVDRRKF